MSSLEFLDLSGNNLSGPLPPRIGASSKLRYFYLSRNKLQGPIAMEFDDSYEIVGLDLSHNDLTGEIPLEIGNLSKFKVLNLSHNSCIESIPPTFSKELESFTQQLEGEIPPQLTELYSLAFFSVAHNNLSGKTPESCYKDNPFLCGQSLPKACGPDMPPSTTPTSTNIEDNGGFMDMEIFYVSFGVAYIMVLLVIGVVLYINPYWRRAWFHFIELSITNCYISWWTIFPFYPRSDFHRLVS
uniref:Uncharacterized protein n=1 Tax=Salix viminalis TaxID=40686 RepID=A0A6N2LPR3_SALVM